MMTTRKQQTEAVSPGETGVAQRLFGGPVRYTKKQQTEAPTQPETLHVFSYTGLGRKPEPFSITSEAFQPSVSAWLVAHSYHEVEGAALETWRNGDGEGSMFQVVVRYVGNSILIVGCNSLSGYRAFMQEYGNVGPLLLELFLPPPPSVQQAVGLTTWRPLFRQQSNF